MWCVCVGVGERERERERERARTRALSIISRRCVITPTRGCTRQLEVLMHLVVVKDQKALPMRPRAKERQAQMPRGGRLRDGEGEEQALDARASCAQHTNIASSSLADAGASVGLSWRCWHTCDRTARRAVHVIMPWALRDCFSRRMLVISLFGASA